MRVRFLVAGVLFPLLVSAACRADVTLIGKASLSGDSTDLSGLTDTLSGNIPHNRLGSFGSGIAYAGKDDLYIACDDRGPLDGEAHWKCRTQTFRISVHPEQVKAVTIDLVATTLLTDEQGRSLTGAADECDVDDQRKGLRFDPEGVRVSPAGTCWISDEYGPWIDEFNTEGKRVRRLDVPAKFRVVKPGPNARAELPPHNVSGRQSNRGFEGLAISPDGTKLWTILQSPLLQDHALDAKGKRIGLNIRVLEVTLSGERAGATRELVYPLAKASNGVSEILAINDHELLVLERDGEVGREAVWRQICKIDIANATDVSNVDSLPSDDLPRTITPVSKSTWLDLASERFGLVGKDMPEKIEGLAFGPTLPDGRRTLIVSVDNDLRTDAPSTFFVFGWVP